MPTTYSPAVISAMADRLYRRAAFVTVAYSIYGFFIGAILAVVSAPSASAALPAIVVGALGLAIGYEVGYRAALRLRFQAQQALVLVEIEKNGQRQRAA